MNPGRTIAAGCVAVLLGAASGHTQEAPARRGFSVEITTPKNQEIVLGKTRIVAEVKIDRPESIDRVEFSVSDKLIFVDREAPFECMHDFGEGSKSWVIRAVAFHVEGISVGDTVVTRKVVLSYVEEVNRIVLWASVTDRDGAFVTGLAREDFRVREDGVEQKILEFYAEDRPMTLALVLDTSGSMRDSMEELHRGAESFVDTLREQDRALVIAFDDKVFLLQDLTSSQEALKESITSTEAIGATALYDALHAAYRKLRGIDGRKAIILLSDGDDTSSQFGFERVLEEAKSESVIIYGIGLGSGLPGGAYRNVVKEFSEQTGGRAFFPNKASELTDVYQKIADELRKQYYLTYSTANTKWDGRFIPVEVDSTRGKLKVRARKGYFAIRPKGPAS
jgi:Ca-activated chloride channel family protein